MDLHVLNMPTKKSLLWFFYLPKPEKKKNTQKMRQAIKEQNSKALTITTTVHSLFPTPHIQMAQSTMLTHQEKSQYQAINKGKYAPF